MSGPKCYSVQVFDKHLKEFFFLKTEILMLADELNQKKLTDEVRGVNYNGEAFTQDYNRLLNSILEHEKPVGTKTINQQQFDDFYNSFHQSKKKLFQMKSDLVDELSRFETIETSYKAYLDLELTLKEIEDNFEVVKNQFFNHVIQHINDTEGVNSLKEQIKKIVLNLQMPPFTDDFSTNAAVFKTQFSDKLEAGKRQLNNLLKPSSSEEKTDFEKKKVTLVNNIQDLYFASSKEAGYTEKVQDTIKELLAGIADTSQAVFFKNKYATLLKKHKIGEVYFFIEFVDEIKERQKQNHLKEVLQRVLKEVNTHIFEVSSQDEARSLKNRIGQLMLLEHLKKIDCDNLMSTWHKLLEKDNLSRKERLIHEEEQKYIKERLIDGLTDLNYEVLTDMEVIDFETNNVFLMSVPNQENFLNIRFDSQGKILYNFLIPQNREELTHEQKAIKLAELDETCTSFKKMLEKLKSEGLNIDLETEIKATEKALVQLPPRYKSFTTRALASKSKKGRFKNGELMK